MAKMNFLEKWIVNSKLDALFHKYFGISQLLRKIPQEGFSAILEVGAGVGITTSFIKEKFPRSAITATDFDPDQVQEARQRLNGTGITVQEEDATRLTFPNTSFDACFAILVFHHVENFPKSIEEIYRVLKPGGKFYVYDISVKSWHLSHLCSPKSLKISSGVFSKQEFEQTVREAGFNILSSEGNFKFVLFAQKPA